MPNHHSLLRTGAFIIGAAVLALWQSGCATASQATAMAAAPSVAVTRHAASVGINVSGGNDTSAMGASNISNADFATAIKSSIEQSGLFAKVTEAPGDYRLDVMIVRLDRPMFGTSFTVNLEANWRLIRVTDGKEIWAKAITSSFTATMSDAFAGVTRLRLANEGAARKNIEDAIVQMGALTLP